MVKLNSPLFSVDAHGSIGKIITYSKRKSGNQVRSYNKPQKPPSAKQRGQRRVTEFLVAQWQNMSVADKAVWGFRARESRLNIAGYHYFLREAGKNLYEHHGLRGYWHFNEIINGYVVDLSGNGNHGRLDPNWPSDAPVLVPSEKPRFGNALYFDGSNDHVDCGNNHTLDFIAAGAFTYALNIYIYTLADKTLARKFDFGNSGFAITVTTNGTMRVFDYRGGWQNSLSATTGLVIEKWYELVYVYNNQSCAFFVDGVQFDTYPIGEPLWNDNTVQPFIINNDYGLDSVNAIIDEVCYYNRPLSAAEIATRYKFATKKI